MKHWNISLNYRGYSSYNLESKLVSELKEAGLREIKIIDNGIGMDKDDAMLAFQRHATSKLYTDDDLFSINSPLRTFSA